MDQMNITKAEFQSFKSDISTGIRALNEKLDKLLDPQTGVFAEIQNIRTANKRAHERIDGLDNENKKIKIHIYGENGRGGVLDKIDDAENTLLGWKTTFKWAMGLLATPILLGIGALIWAAITGGKL